MPLAALATGVGYQPVGKNPKLSVLENPLVDIAIIGGAWCDIEQSAGVYTFNSTAITGIPQSFDAQMALVATANTNRVANGAAPLAIRLHIATGGSWDQTFPAILNPGWKPQWLRAFIVANALGFGGGQFFSFLDTSIGGGGGPGVLTEIPVHWEPNYLARLNLLMQAVNAHLIASWSTLNVFAVIVPWMCAAATDDWNTGPVTNGIDGVAPTNSTPQSRWLTALAGTSYSTWYDAALAAGATMFGNFASAVPHLYLASPINRMTNYSSGMNPNGVASHGGNICIDTMTAANVAFPGRIIASKWNLNVGAGPSSSVQITSQWYDLNLLHTQGMLTYTQMVAAAYNDPACPTLAPYGAQRMNYNHGPCINSTLALYTAVNNGASYGSKWEEIYEVDIQHLGPGNGDTNIPSGIPSDVISYARSILFNSPLPVYEQYGMSSTGVSLYWTRYNPVGVSGQVPAVIMLHPGGYKSGGATLHAQGVDLQNAGFLAFGTEYRLAPPSGPMNVSGGHPSPGQDTVGDPGHYPEQTTDVQLAIRTARAHPLCNGLVYCLGGSAGASHSMFMAATGTPGDDMPDLIVCCSTGISNLADPNSWSLVCVDSETCPHGAVANYLNITDTAPALPAGVDLITCQQASPSFHFKPGMPPMFIICSSKDSLGIPCSTGFSINSYNSDSTIGPLENGANGAIPRMLAAGYAQSTALIPEYNSFKSLLISVVLHEHAFEYWNLQTSSPVGLGPNVIIPWLKGGVPPIPPPIPPIPPIPPGPLPPVPVITQIPGGASGITDESIVEDGSVVLIEGQSVVQVEFDVRKRTANYRFAYLYVDTMSASSDFPPGAITVVPVVQSITGFMVNLSGFPPFGVTPVVYTLRWKVVIVSYLNPAQLDEPESIYTTLPNGGTSFTYFFANAKSSIDYGFDELRVENLIDDPAGQFPIDIQITAKALDQFSILLSPPPNSGNYSLVARTNGPFGWDTINVSPI